MMTRVVEMVETEKVVEAEGMIMGNFHLVEEWAHFHVNKISIMPPKMETMEIKAAGLGVDENIAYGRRKRHVPSNQSNPYDIATIFEVSTQWV